MHFKRIRVSAFRALERRGLKIETLLYLTCATSLSGIVYISLVVRDIQRNLAGQTQEKNVTNEPEYNDTFDSDFDERILAFQAELDAITAEKELQQPLDTPYDLPHSSVKTPKPFNPEYAD